MQHIVYSIIIPHKNCPDLLSRCLSSIPDREDVQIVVIDDNSDDDKKPVVDPKKAELVKLDAAHSKGAGRARNVGLEKAVGKWLLFADADDCYTDNLNKLFDKYAEDTDTDIVYLNVNVFDNLGKTWPHDIDSKIKAYLNGEVGAEMRLRYRIWTPWTRMVRKEMVQSHQLRFDETPACNDMMICLNCSRYAKNIAVEQNVVYQYFRPIGGSLTDKYRTPLLLETMLDMSGRMLVLYEEVGFSYRPSFLHYFIKSEFSTGLPIKVKMEKYKKALKKYHVSMFTDVKRYIDIRIADRLKK